jgi:hypothetical protein
MLRVIRHQQLTTPIVSTVVVTHFRLERQHRERPAHRTVVMTMTIDCPATESHQNRDAGTRKVRVTPNICVVLAGRFRLWRRADYLFCVL